MDKTRKRGKFQPKGDEYILVGYSEESKAYRLWKPGTRTVIKARDVRFFEKSDSINTSTKDLSTISDNTEASTFDNLISISLEQPDLQCEEHQQQEDDDRDETDESANEIELQDTPNEYVGEVHRGRGRPKFLKTGQPGRPKKMYQTRSTKTPDPESVPDALSSDNNEA